MQTFNFLAMRLGSNPTSYYLYSFICESFVMRFPYKATSVCCILYMLMGFGVFQYFNLSGNPWGTVWHTILKTYLLVISLLGFSLSGWLRIYTAGFRHLFATCQLPPKQEIITLGHDLHIWPLSVGEYSRNCQNQIQYKTLWSTKLVLSDHRVFIN